MTFKDRINDGLSGKYSGLSNGLDRINKYIFGIQRSCYTLIGGMSGAAKTTFVDFTLINAIQDAKYKNIPINIFYYSLEIDENSKKANWLSVIIYNKYSVVIPPEKIKGLGGFRLSKEELELVDDTLPELDELWSKINWIWESTNPTGIYKSMWTFMSNRGDFIYEPYIDELGNEKQRIVKFVNKNSEEYNIVVGDHLALLHLERGFTLKENLDKISEYSVRLRNLFGMTLIWLQQFNQGLNSVDRAKFKGVDISPQQSDFKDSTSPYQDADIVIGIMNAYKMDMETCLGYNINVPMQGKYNLRDKFRLIKIIKNRLSRDNISIGLLFQAEAGYFEELKLPNEFDLEYIDKINKLVNNR
jgi:replicative DNA helicase